MQRLINNHNEKGNIAVFLPHFNQNCELVSQLPKRYVRIVSIEKLWDALSSPPQKHICQSAFGKADL